MALWTTYLAFIARNQSEILFKLKCTGTHGATIRYVARDRGNDAVAPSETLLSSFKDKKITWEEYKHTYLMDLRDSAEAYHWMRNAAEDTENFEVILVCFEKITPSKPHCHRVLLAEEILRLFPNVEYKGELSQVFEEA